jgi:ParB family chromosome partitioning protein
MATKKRYNFKGLDEIFGESVSDLVENLESDTKKAKELSSEISVADIVPNPFQPRKIFNEDNIKELSESIKIHGIIQPIIVNEIKKGEYQIVAGERRFRAAQLAGLKTVPVVVATLTSEQMEEFAIIENIQRVDLTDIEEAIAYKKLSATLNLKQEAIANRVGKSRSHVANIMRLLNLPQNIQDSLLNRELSMGQAKPLLAILSNEKLVQKVFERIKKDNLTARDVEALIKKLQADENENVVATKSRDPFLNSVENKLMVRYGTKISINNKKITLTYNDDEDLNRILDIMGYEFE